jgi:hypothetical protein
VDSSEANAQGEVVRSDCAIFSMPVEVMASAEPIVAAASHRARFALAGAMDVAVPEIAIAAQKISPDDASRRNEAAILFSSKKIELNANQCSFWRNLTVPAYPDAARSPTK